jgi:hypothetical protein
VHYPACADVDKDRHAQPLKGGRHHDEKVAAESRGGMIYEVVHDAGSPVKKPSLLARLTKSGL